MIAEAEAERQRRADAEGERQRMGTTRRGKAPQPVDETPDDRAQSNLIIPSCRSRAPATNAGSIAAMAKRV